MLASYHNAAVALRKATSVVVCGHVKPDGDALASVLALTLALREVGIHAVPTLADETDAPALYDFLPGFGLFVPASQLEQPDAFVALDSPSPERLGSARQLAESSTTLVVMDHHPDSRPYGTVNILDPTVAATSQLVWQLTEALGVARTPDIATCCYVALVTDTGRFAHDNTTARALRDAAEMVEAGADPAEMARHLYQNRSLASLRIEARALSRLTLVNEGRVAYTWLGDADFDELGARREDTETLPDVVRQVGGIDVAIVLRQAGGEVRVNLRAKAGFDVGSVARLFGGGGHLPAAGFTWLGGQEELLRELLPKLPGWTAT
ncbi:MAG: bifunctional oligoribonuclease/PAP phosphatase NrnA [Coriobacteriia bacterium]